MKRPRLMAAGVVAGLLALATPAAAQTTPHEAFEAYRGAVTEGRGQATGALVSAGTIDVYDRVRRAAFEGDPASALRLSLVEALLALRLRAAVPAAELRGMTGHAVVGLAAERGLIGGGFSGLRLGPAEIYGERAVAQQLDAAGRPVGVWWTFLREGGIWRVDLRPNLEAGEALLRERLRASGQPRAEFLRTLANDGR